ncbi:hypothetical protein DH2020_037174 [Rehmannia glutinosa]|uniref:CYCLOIDEA-like protein n=1 Tax=Rehmannia glutinosa TaxID=99300 RepID=A0ABR0V4U4_REHGL
MESNPNQLIPLKHKSQGPESQAFHRHCAKFFDLQEMLGFDKPSKTLDWLLTKSKAAIKELVQTKQASGKSSSECELLSPNGEAAYGYGEHYGSKSGNKNNNDNKGASSSNLAKESRAKARARARERTREKMLGKNVNTTSSDLNTFIPNIQDHQPMFHCPATSHHDLIQESVVIKRRSKNNPNSFFGFQAQNVTENWDICSYASQSSNLCAILDQHKFMNRYNRVTN